MVESCEGGPLGEMYIIQYRYTIVPHENFENYGDVDYALTIFT